MDNSNSTNPTTGGLRISRDVITSIAKLSTMEIEGVDSVATANTGFKGFMNKANYLKPIKIVLTEDVVSIEISVVVKPGFKIPVLAEAVQNNVKNAIQSMTGLAVARVDVVISGIANQEAQKA